MSIDSGLRNYLVITGSYWVFTLTDGAIRMLVLLYFHLLGYSPLEVATLFLLYELFGVVTNLIGGWLGARIGLNFTMQIGMALQIVALLLLTVPEAWLSIPYVMAAQALSGVAKDLNKMSAKASVKRLLPEGGGSRLFKWVALLTGSKNSLKGIGFFLGALLLELAGFRGALLILSAALLVTLVVSSWLLPSGLGRSSGKAKFSEIFSRSAAVNWLSAARFFLFGARDVWFVVGLPLFLYSVLGWSFTEVGGFMALWIIAYGVVQASAPRLLRQSHHGRGPDGATALRWVVLLVGLPPAIIFGLRSGADPTLVLMVGLFAFGAVFAINSAVHSYLIVAWSDHDRVSMNVGFYYMANAGGRLLGTLISGWAYQVHGLEGCLWWATVFLLLASLLSIPFSRSAGASA